MEVEELSNTIRSEKHRIQGTDNLLMMTIKDQASDLEHGWREVIQNGLDAPGSENVYLSYDANRTIVYNDGESISLSAEDGRRLLTHLGASSKDRDDDTTIGQFGVGKGQIVAKGRTTFISDGVALHFDVEGWGLEIVETPADDAVAFLADENEGWAEAVQESLDAYGTIDTGVLVVIDHYEDEVPYEGSYRWDTYENRLADRFRFATVATGVRVYCNDDCISDETPGEALTSDSYSSVKTFESDVTGPVHIAVRHGSSDSLKVYSNGIYVKDAATRGLCGYVVTKRNLDLNFARNEIKSGCERWAAIEEHLDEIRRQMFTAIPDDRLNGEARDFIATEMFEAEAGIEKYGDISVFRTASESYVSLSEIRSRNQVGFAKATDPAADRLSESLGMLVMDENDSATSKLQNKWESLGESMALPTVFDPRDKAESMGLFTGHETIRDTSGLEPRVYQRFAIARLLAHRLGIEREIRWGRSDVAAAWTDGYDYIVITEAAASSSTWMAWLPELYETIVHEWAHNHSTKEGCASHGANFNRDYREKLTGNWSVLSELITEIHREGIRTVTAKSDGLFDN